MPDTTTDTNRPTSSFAGRTPDEVYWLSSTGAPARREPVFLGRIGPPLGRHAHDVAGKSLSPDVALDTGVGAVGTGGVATGRRYRVFLLDERADVRGHANVIGRNRLTPHKALLSWVSRG